MQAEQRFTDASTEVVADLHEENPRDDRCPPPQTDPE
jgi:hypothetical protein